MSNLKHTELEYFPKDLIDLFLNSVFAKFLALMVCKIFLFMVVLNFSIILIDFIMVSAGNSIASR